MSRARARTERGTQSIERSSSMIEPLMRAIAYVSNLMSRSRSKRSIAPMRPRSPYETRSSSSTCAGSPLPSRPATYLTSGAYVRIRRSRSPLFAGFARKERQRVWVSSTWELTGLEKDTALTGCFLTRRAERADREAAHPECEHSAGDDDHPGAAGVGGGRDPGEE